jgi:cation:H+ antiporter
LGQIFIDLGLVLVGMVVAILASRRAVRSASALALGLKVPPFFIGITILAIGTDLPEIANSIAASVAGHGDVNVGDSIGSAITQLTLVLGLLPFFAQASVIGRKRVAVLGVLTAAALGVGALLLFDGMLSRSDGAVLALLWIVSTLVVWKSAPPASEPELPVASTTPLRDTGTTALALGFVAGGAALATWAFIRLATRLDVPEYLISFFALAVGTSLPELVVDVTAFRQGQKDLAIGGIFGASLLDSTLSLGAGPLIAPTEVTASLALRGNLGAVVVVLGVTLLLSLRRKLDRKSGALLLLGYAAFYPLLLMGS